MRRLILFLCYAAPLLARPTAEQRAPGALDVDYSVILDGNDVACFAGNTGLLAYDLTGLRGQQNGFYFPDNWPAENTTLIYSAGLWLAGVTSQGDTLVAVADYTSEHGPGAWGTNPQDDEWRVWAITDDPASWEEWPYTQGAPTAAHGHEPWIADLPGVSQMLWAVCNDGDPALHDNIAGSTEPMGVELRLTAWCSTAPDSGTTDFFRWELLNQGSCVFTEFWAGIWVDADLGGASDDLAGCEPARQLGFVYNGDDDDASYGMRPPALGAVLLYGLHEPAPGDSAFYQGAWHAGGRNRGLDSFTGYNNGLDPQDFRHTLFMLQGLRPNGQPRPAGPFDFTGDPVGGTGELDPTPCDRRILLGCGPVVFAPGERQELSGALSAAQDDDRLASLNFLRLLAPLPAGMVSALPGPGPARPRGPRIAAVWPNPFNPETRVELELARPAAEVRLLLFDLAGREVWNRDLGPLTGGAHTIGLRPEGLPSGLYLLDVRADEARATGKALLLR